MRAQFSILKDRLPYENESFLAPISPATLDWSAVSKPKLDMMVKRAEPTATNDSVRSPAGFSELRLS
jgi:hypothetical protein